MRSSGNFKHGMSNTRFYKIFCGIKSRCNDKNCNHYKWYGKRGIKVSWSSFIKFKQDMYCSYIEHTKLYGEKDTTLERIDNNGYYCKNNCKWITQKEQARNTRNLKIITFNGESKSYCEWAEKIHIKKSTLWKRIVILKWPLEKAISSNLYDKEGRIKTISN